MDYELKITKDQLQLVVDAMDREIQICRLCKCSYHSERLEKINNLTISVLSQLPEPEHYLVKTDVDIAIEHAVFEERFEEAARLDRLKKRIIQK